MATSSESGGRVPFRSFRESRSGRERSGRRFRRGGLREPERLEVRTLLNASVDVVDGVLTYATDPGAAEVLRISADGGLLTFASNAAIDVLDAGGLVVEGDGTTTVTAAGVLGLKVVVRRGDATATMASVGVATRLDLTAAGGTVRLGDGSEALGLGALTAAIVVVGSGDDRSRVTIDDRGSARDVGYLVAGDAVAATGGFGGVAYAGLGRLELLGAAGGEAGFLIAGLADGTETSVTSSVTAGGASRFVVPADARFDAGWLEANGGAGTNAFEVGRLPKFGYFNAPDGLLTVTDAATMAAVVAEGEERDLRYSYGLRVVLDASAGTLPTQARLFRPIFGLWQLRIGGMITTPSAEDFTFKAPRGLANTFEFVLGEGKYAISTDMKYDGGYDPATGAASRLIVTGSIPKTTPEPVDPESKATHVATGPGSGEIWYDIRTHSGNPMLPNRWYHWGLHFSGLSPDGVSDDVAVGSYNFIYSGAADPALALRSEGGANLQITSQATPPAFIGVRLGGGPRGSLVIDTGGVAGAASTIDLVAATSRDDLPSITLRTSPNDEVRMLGEPAILRLVQVLYDAPPRPTPAEPIPTDPVDPTPTDPRARRFGSAMRRGPATQPTRTAAQAFRAARLERLAELRQRRAERLRDLRAALGRL